MVVRDAFRAVEAKLPVGDGLFHACVEGLKEFEGLTGDGRADALAVGLEERARSNAARVAQSKTRRLCRRQQGHGDELVDPGCEGFGIGRQCGGEGGSGGAAFDGEDLEDRVLARLVG